MSSISATRGIHPSVDWFHLIAGVVLLVAFALLALAAYLLLEPFDTIAASPGYIVSAVTFLVLLTVIGWEAHRIGASH